MSGSRPRAGSVSMVASVVTAMVMLGTLTIGAPAASATPPSAPRGVFVRTVDGHNVIRWRPAIEPDPDDWVRTYEIERDGVWVGWTWATESHWVDPDAVPGDAHLYRVYATDRAREVGRRSPPVVVGDVGRPGAPGRLRVVDRAGGVDLRWRPSVDTDGRIVRYRILRDGSRVATLAGTATGWTDRSARPTERHRYVVRAYDDDGRVSEPARVRTPASRARILLAAGDLGECRGDPAAVAALLATHRGTFAAIGDLAYPDGTSEDFARCYAPSFGRFVSRTRPVPGNHDWVSADATGYFDYFGDRGGAAGGGWSSYDLGAWHVVGLNSECWYGGGCGTGDPQYEWLARDLSATDQRCILAYWHRAIVTTEAGQENASHMAPYFELLRAAGADVVVSAHAHVYERWPRIDPWGAPAADGLRSFTVGTGGATLRGFDAQATGPEVRGSAHGLLRLVLRDHGYSWEFLPVAGETFTDRGEDRC